MIMVFAVSPLCLCHLFPLPWVSNSKRQWLSHIVTGFPEPSRHLHLIYLLSLCICHFRPLGAQSQEERPRMPRVHPQVHGGVEQRPVCESQPPDQPGWETPPLHIHTSHLPPPTVHNRLLKTFGKSYPDIVVLELAKYLVWKIPKVF